jgi:hypothetical protein
MTMININNSGLYAQGDVLIEAGAKLPKGAVEVQPRGEAWVIAHSETGHHHLVYSGPGRRLFRKPDDAPGICYLVVDGAYAELLHTSPTGHEAYRLAPGTYKFTRQRELTPEGWEQAVQD